MCIIINKLLNTINNCITLNYLKNDYNLLNKIIII